MTEVEISQIQKQFWVLQNLHRNNTAYNIPVVLRIAGIPDINALEYAINQLVARHESLRASFREKENRIFQTTESAGYESIKPEVVKINGPFVENPLHPLIMEEVHKTFVLSDWPLFRIKLFSFTDSISVLTIVFHHIIIDLQSKKIFSEEFSEIYNSYRGKYTPALDALPADYSVFAMHEQKWLDSAEAGEMKKGWLNYISRAPETLVFPSDSTGKKISNLEGKRKHFIIDNNLSSRIIRFAYEKSVNSFTVLLTSYAILLNRLTNQSTFTIGVPLTNRRNPEFRNSFGCFVNIVPVIVSITENMTGSDLLKQIRQSMLTVHRLQEIPFLQINELLPGMRGNSFLKAGFTFEPPMNLSLNSLDIEPVVVEKEGSQLELFMTLWEQDHEFNGYLEFSTLLFTENTIHRYISIFKRIIESFIGNPESLTAELNILSEEEFRLIDSWNDTDNDYSDNICLHQKFEQQVRKTPDLPAILYDNCSLSYLEFDLHVNRMANFLITSGVRTEDIVCVCMERSPELLIAIYAIHKAGAAYLPVDPNFPMERIGMILTDARPVLILTKIGYGHNIPSGFVRIFLDDIMLSSLSEDDRPPETEVNSGNLAYLMYTSGSTGKPKGVMIEHHSVLNKLEWMQRQHPLDKEDTILLKTPVTFDVSVWELFWWMFSGAKLAILPPGGEKDPATIIKEVETKSVTTIVFVPSMFSPLVGYLKVNNAANRLRTLKWIIQIGEALSPQLVSSFNELLTADFNPLMVNTYGPTEATVAVSWFNCPKEKNIEKIYIGKPIQNTKLLVLNGRNRIQPAGVTGELVITGTNLARGYLNRPDLNSEKFIEFVYPDGRMLRGYKTGDLVKWTDDGNIDFIGRADTQVKIRGHRIELGDIEAKLLDFPAVKSAAVIVNQSNPENKYIVGYVAMKKSGSSTTEEIRRFLTDKLPDYMIPAHLMILNDLPLNTSGKIDRKALPEPDFLSGEQFVAPASSNEKKLQQIWRELLKVENIGISHNFFDLGGNSLLAIRLVSEIKEKFDINIEPIHIMEYPNIRALAGFLSETGKEMVSIRGNLGEETDARKQSFSRLKQKRSQSSHSEA